MRKEKTTNCQLADWIPDQINGYHINCYQMELLRNQTKNPSHGIQFSWIFCHFNDPDNRQRQTELKARVISSFIVLSMHILSMTIVKSKTNESLNNNLNNQQFNGRSMINLHFHFKLENEINSRHDSIEAWFQTRLKLDFNSFYGQFLHIFILSMTTL